MKRNWVKKGNRRGGEKVKGKSRHCCVTFKPKTTPKILISVRAQTSEADILNQ